MTKEGLKAVKVLSKEGVKTNVTLVFRLPRGFWPVLPRDIHKPVLGRLDDVSNEGMEVVTDL